MSECANNADCSSGFSCIKSICEKDRQGLPLVAWIGIGIGAILVLALAITLMMRCSSKKVKAKERPGPAPLPAGYMKPVDLLQVAQVNQREQQRMSYSQVQSQLQMPGFQGQSHLGNSTHNQNSRNTVSQGYGQNRYSYYPQMYDQNYNTDVEIQAWEMQSVGSGSLNYGPYDQVGNGNSWLYAQEMTNGPHRMQEMTNGPQRMQEMTNGPQRMQEMTNGPQRMQEMNMADKKGSLLLDVSKTGSVSSAPASPARSTPLIEFSPVRSPTVESTEGPVLDLGEIGNSPTEVTSVVAESLDSSPSRGNTLTNLNNMDLDRDILSPPPKSQDQVELEEEAESSPALPLCQVSPALPALPLGQISPALPTLPLRQSSPALPPLPPRQSSPALPPRQSSPALPPHQSTDILKISMHQENTMKAKEVESAPMSDHMNSFFSNRSASSSSSKALPKSPVAPTRTIASENMATNVVNEVSRIDEHVESAQSVNESSIASEYGDSIQSLDTLVEPTSSEVLKEKNGKNSEVSNRVRPAGGRPLPSHMKFS